MLVKVRQEIKKFTKLNSKPDTFMALNNYSN